MDIVTIIFLLILVISIVFLIDTKMVNKISKNVRGTSQKSFEIEDDHVFIHLETA